MGAKINLTKAQKEAFLNTLKLRFEKNKDRHKGIDWSTVQERIASKAEKLGSLFQMEETGGEPDLVDFDKKTGEFIFFDCAPESPKGRRSICYDQAALDARKEFKPANNAITMAKEMGIELLTEQQYRALQQLGTFDSKTSSWVKTPDEIRKLGGAIFCDRRYNTVFVYHNGAESYYAGRAFRGALRV